MNSKIMIFSLLVCGTLLFDYSCAWYQQSVKSWVFEPLRPKEPPKRITAECGSVITEPYGRLEKTFERGQVEVGSKCTWTLRAPANHVVNIILVGFDFEKQILEATPAGDFSGSHIYIRDDKAPINRKDVREYTVSNYQLSHGQGFDTSSSTTEELVVEVEYHDSVFAEVQKIYVEYEFLNVDDMNRLLRQHKFIH